MAAAFTVVARPLRMEIYLHFGTVQFMLGT